MHVIRFVQRVFLLLSLKEVIDTLHISKQLQESGISPKEADAIATQMARFAESELASKQNLKETELLLKKEIEEVRLTLSKEIVEVKLTLGKEIEEVRLSLGKEIEEVRLSLGKEIEEVKLLFQKELNAHLKWVIGFLVGQAAVIVTLIKLL